MTKEVPGRHRKRVHVYRADCDNCIRIEGTDACFTMAEARQLVEQLFAILRAPPNCVHGFDTREACAKCTELTSLPATG